jgi:Neutral/alkaline non-lysosomal ceramidase, N-terminal
MKYLDRQAVALAPRKTRQVRMKHLARTQLLTSLALACLLACLPASAANTLRAGVASVDITSPPGIRLWGYSDRTTPATGTLDPLYARVLVLEAGEKRFALVTVDLGRAFGPTSLEWLRDATRNQVSFLVVAASHTHSGPVVQDHDADATPAWESAALKKLADAVKQAATHLVPARIGVGYGVAYIGHNRLRVNQNGAVEWFERNPTQVPTTPVDGTVSVLRVDAENGDPIAILVNYACHAVVFGSDNLQYSADFPAALSQTVEGAFGSKPICFFLQGAAGDINPYYAVTALTAGGVQARDWTGQALGREVVRVAKGIHTRPDENSQLQFSEDRLRVRMRWDPAKWKEAMAAVFGPEAAQIFPAKVPEEVELPVATVLIDRTLAMLFLPGEPFVEYQVAWRQRCPVADAFLVGYANGYNGYFPTIRSATLGGYGAANPATWVEVGAGDRMLDEGVIRVDQMLGRIGDVPEDLK